MARESLVSPWLHPVERLEHADQDEMPKLPDVLVEDNGAVLCREIE
jgi:hypothetical protein